mmetsp:Transcript_27565/g.75208  ORF Transcript_27565/g.75208 Transcript_27565/m.75208 type:complete len:336 (-) Transcript_27565:176-1183(-)
MLPFPLEENKMKSSMAFLVFFGLLFCKQTIFAWTASTSPNKDPTVNRPHISDPIPEIGERSMSLTSKLTTSTTTRRNLFANGSSLTAAVAAVAMASPQPSKAAAPLDAGEAIRRGASNLPGYGSSDVFYPESFAGSWKMTREVEFPSAVTSSSPPPILRLTYPVRFIRSIEDDAVVADRGFNQAELEAALVRSTRQAGSETSATATPSIVRSYDWTANNPNVLKVVLSNGTKKEVKVTKRATERTAETVSSSEFQRVTQEDANNTGPNGNVGGIPVISARRVVSKWRKIDDSTLEGIEIVYAMGGGGDPLSAGLPSSSASQSPTVLSKSRLYLVR